ncbi:AAA family ATPase [Rhizobium sp. L1K21]|uniref:AAA family ATPase n=1 Tax=Rhizobium sp. L1K21 TaxID=2954933 RepID=UPI0020933FEE|nr:AAA family ATPase [Rhizobium sp. L1K21]MCO6188353.1 AAA family ATPase [Rhizobium sp. L1K21]
MNKRVLISGCSGGGKSTLLQELSARGYATVEEPGRRIVQEEKASGGKALPWIDMEAFARRAIDMALVDHAAHEDAQNWAFFDRGLIDALAALQHTTGAPLDEKLAASHRYNTMVFITPPWPEIYASDPERRHGLNDAIAEYERLLQTFPSLGYTIILLPKTPVGERADFILRCLAEQA